ncbi:MAG: glycosyltransferase [Anaerolineales bacterium]|nr:glycosyltransferase [Anaerolineales bacterium]
MHRILIIIPAFNESARIAEVVRQVRAKAPDCDVLVVDDGSPDGTALAARAAGALVISHPFNLGYGVTIQTGYKYALRHGYDFLMTKISSSGLVRAKSKTKRNSFWI